MQRYYFEGKIPSLDEICGKIKHEYHSAVEIEMHSFPWGDIEDDDYETEEEKKRMERFYSDMMGIEKGPVTTEHYILKSNGEEIGLSTYTCRVKHIDLSSCHTKKTFELYEFATKILEQYGGKVHEFTEEQIRQVKRNGYLELFYFFVKIAVLAALYIYFNFTIWQLVGVIAMYLIVKQITVTILAYKQGKKHGWL